MPNRNLPTPAPIAPIAPVNWKRLFAFSAGGLALGLACFAFALFRTPSWYQLPVIAPQDRQQVRNNLIDAEQAFTESLRAGVGAGPFTYHLYQDDVNRWIAMRREIYPLIDELAPPLLTDPFVRFDAGRITIAGKYRIAGASLCVSVDIDTRYREGAIVLKVAAVRCGSVRLSGFLDRLGLAERVEREAGGTWPGSPRISGDLLRGLIVDDEAWWKNGGVDYRVVGLTVEPGRVNLDVLPLGRHESRRDRNHSMLPGED